MENIIMTLTCLLCGGIFYGIGYSANKSSKPAQFWSGKAIKKEDISDVPSYNKACSVLWTYYSMPFFLAAMCSIMGFIKTSGVIVTVVSVPGIGILIMQYLKIEKKYRI